MHNYLRFFLRGLLRVIIIFLRLGQCFQFLFQCKNHIFSKFKKVKKWKKRVKMSEYWWFSHFFSKKNSNLNDFSFFQKWYFLQKKFTKSRKMYFVQIEITSKFAKLKFEKTQVCIKMNKNSTSVLDLFNPHPFPDIETSMQDLWVDPILAPWRFQVMISKTSAKT